jgi:hypothetical protein
MAELRTNSILIYTVHCCNLGLPVIPDDPKFLPRPEDESVWPVDEPDWLIEWDEHSSSPPKLKEPDSLDEKVEEPAWDEDPDWLEELVKLPDWPEDPEPLFTEPELAEE